MSCRVRCCITSFHHNSFEQHSGASFRRKLSSNDAQVKGSASTTSYWQLLPSAARKWEMLPLPGILDVITCECTAQQSYVLCVTAAWWALSFEPSRRVHYSMTKQSRCRMICLLSHHSFKSLTGLSQALGMQGIHGYLKCCLPFNTDQARTRI